jgi:uncharacterized protein YbbK (DUF523 family)
MMKKKESIGAAKKKAEISKQLTLIKMKYWPWVESARPNLDCLAAMCRLNEEYHTTSNIEEIMEWGLGHDREDVRYMFLNCMNQHVYSKEQIKAILDHPSHLVSYALWSVRGAPFEENQIREMVASASDALVEVAIGKGEVRLSDSSQWIVWERFKTRNAYDHEADSVAGSGVVSALLEREDLTQEVKEAAMQSNNKWAWLILARRADLNEEQMFRLWDKNDVTVRVALAWNEGIKLPKELIQKAISCGLECLKRYTDNENTKRIDEEGDISILLHLLKTNQYLPSEREESQLGASKNEKIRSVLCVKADDWRECREHATLKESFGQLKMGRRKIL